ncbi:MAG: hypothetical protein DLM55_04390 [Acidimicrobiales bacterium]|nr:MAG: hypothetical protein DLM55_04390 [Acidimicrobiales bacterium]
MAGIHDVNVIDLVTHFPESGEYALIMIETRPWTDSPEQLFQLREKINNYAMFAMDEGMIRAYPQAAGKPLCIRLDCPNPPSTQVAGLIEHARQYLADYKIRFVVNVLG